MTLTDLDVGREAYTVYASLEEANRILAVDPQRMRAWAAASDEDKTISLIAATERLDVLRWRGERTGGSKQANAWPRTGLLYPGGEDVPDNEVPNQIERATAILAGSIAGSPKQADAGQSARTVRRVRAGSAEVTFAGRAETRLPIQDETVYHLVRDWLDSSSAVAVGAAYGTDQQSALAEGYDRTRSLA